MMVLLPFHASVVIPVVGAEMVVASQPMTFTPSELENPVVVTPW